VPPHELPPERLVAYVGRYETRLNTVELTISASELIANVVPEGGFQTKDSPPWPAPPPTRAAFFAEDAIMALDTPWTGGRAEFLRDPAGRIACLRWVVGLPHALSGYYDSVACLVGHRRT
jgi:hypothetical protein